MCLHRRVARSILSTGFTTFGSGCQKTIPKNYDRSVLLRKYTYKSILNRKFIRIDICENTSQLFNNNRSETDNTALIPTMYEY